MRFDPLVPHRPAAALGLALAAGAAVAAFCLLYNALAGQAEGVGTAVIWSIVHVIPFALAFEVGKLRAQWRERALLMGVAMAVSLLLQAASGTIAPVFDALRRLPPLLLVAGSWLVAGRLRPARPVAVVPIDPAGIDWIEASANYVVAHGGGRSATHRVTLSELERRFAGHGFVRVHRSILVRRGAIARVRPVDVVLTDGTSIRTGARYRGNLPALAG